LARFLPYDILTAQRKSDSFKGGEQDVVFQNAGNFTYIDTYSDILFRSTDLLLLQGCWRGDWRHENGNSGDHVIIVEG
jgi:hypothetical protein